MAIGSNVSLKDKLIKKTTSETNIKNIANNINKKSITSKDSSHRDMMNRNATNETKKATFYVKNNLLQKLYNFAYWERHSITEAFNLVLSEGLKGKNTKDTTK